MTNQQKLNRLFQIINIAFFVLIALSGSGCAGSRIEYAPPDPKLVGKVFHFKSPMAYIVFSDKAKAKEYGFLYPQIDGKEIIREVVFKHEVDDEYGILHKYPRESIKDGMAFTILVTYWVRHGWFKRGFSHEYQQVILIDENNILSACSIRDVTSLETDFMEQ